MDKQWQVILYNLKNGDAELKSLVVDKKPTEEEAEFGRILYGAEHYEIVEVTHG